MLIAIEIKRCPKCQKVIADGEIFCSKCKQYLKAEKNDSNNVAGIAFFLVVVIFVVILVSSLSKTETATTEKPDFRPWFDKPQSQWTEKDKQEYMEYHMKRMNDKAENEKAFN